MHVRFQSDTTAVLHVSYYAGPVSCNQRLTEDQIVVQYSYHPENHDHLAWNLTLSIISWDCEKEEKHKSKEDRDGRSWGVKTWTESQVTKEATESAAAGPEPDSHR